MSLFKRKAQVLAARPHVTPDPQQAAALERRLAELSYQPTYGFLRDQYQVRCERPEQIELVRLGGLVA